MELTYNNIKETVKKYFDSLPSIEGPQDEKRILEFFAPDFKVHRFNLPELVEGREGFVKHLCGHADQFRAIVSYEPPPLGIMIDERRGMASMLMVEEFRHPVSGEQVDPKIYLFTAWEFCIHENKVKAKRELILHITGYL